MDPGRRALLASMERLVQLDDQEQELLAMAYNEGQVAKKAMVIHAGDVSDREIFVVSGCLRLFFIDEAGRQVTLSFAPEGWWTGDLASFTQRMPSRFFVEAVEDTVFLSIEYAEKEKLFHEVPKLERAFRLMVQRHLSALQDRFVQMVSGSAELCYTDFLHKYPSLSGRVPQQVIASYVGITPEFLSKLRSRMSRRG